MSDEKKKPKLPPEIRNKLMRSKKPHIALLEGPGPFQPPSLTAVEGTVKSNVSPFGVTSRSDTPRTYGRLDSFRLLVFSAILASLGC